jgi:hypothetical protein
MSIAATRIYRSLADFASATEVYVILSSSPLTLIDVTSAMVSGKAPRIGRNVPTSKLTFAAPTSPRRTEVAMDTSHEQYLTPLTDQDVIYIGRESPEQLRDKPRGLSFDDDPESGAGRCVPE